MGISQLWGIVVRLFLRVERRAIARWTRTDAKFFLKKEWSCLDSIYRKSKFPVYMVPQSTTKNFFEFFLVLWLASRALCYRAPLISIAVMLEVLLEKHCILVSGVRNLVSARFLFTVNGSRGVIKSELEWQKASLSDKKQTWVTKRELWVIKSELEW